MRNLAFESTKVDEHTRFTGDKTSLFLGDYFEGKITSSLPNINPQGTGFQKSVWCELLKIPYGSTITYEELAIRLGNKNKIRAVASAVAANPILIIIPCHRVIGSDGSLRGFSAGIERKQNLLELENAPIQKQLF